MCLLLCLLCSLGLHACGWTQAPKSSESLFEPMSVREPLSDEDSASLMLLKTGQWALIIKQKDSPLHTTKPGQLLGTFMAGQSAPEHLFAAVTSHEWGVILQRLDHNPITIGKAQVQVRPISATNIQGLCIGTQALESSTCLSNAPLGTRWSVYHTDKQGKLRVRKNLGAFGSPVARRALVQTQSNTSTPQFPALSVLPILPDSGAKGWFAIAHTSASPALPTVGIAHDCPSVPKTIHTRGVKAGAYALRTSTKNLGASAHFVLRERHAYDLGVDAMLSCSTNRLTIPSLWRPNLIGRDQDSLGPPLFGAASMDISGIEDSARWALALAAAHTAVGDWAGADAHMERALNNGPSSTQLNAVVLKAAQISAMVRPEVALAWINTATLSAWRRDTDPSYHTVQGTVFDALGFSKLSLESFSKLGELAMERVEDPLRPWFAWREATIKIEAGQFLYTSNTPSMAKGFGEVDQDLWMSGLYLKMKQEDLIPKQIEPELIKRFTPQGILPLYAALEGQKVARPCPSKDFCPLDTYGRRVQAVLALIDEGNAMEVLARSPKIQVQPGFDLIKTSSAPVSTLLTQLGSNDRESSSVAFDPTNNAHCALLPWLVLSAPKTPERATAWMMRRALPVLCKTQTSRALKALVNELETAPDAPQRAERARALLPSLGLMRVGAPAGMSMEVARAQASLGLAYEDTDACLQGITLQAWALTLSDQRSQALELVQNMSACGKDASEQTLHDASLVQSIVTYEQTGTYGFETSPYVRATLKTLQTQALARPCPGLMPTPSLRPMLSSSTQATAQRIASGLTSKTAKTPPPVNHARAQLKQAAQHLSEANINAAAGVLIQAQEAFLSTRTSDGVRATAWIERHLFGGDFEHPERAPDWILTRIKDGQLQLLYQELAALKTPTQAQTNAWLAIGLLFDGFEATGARVLATQSKADDAALCD